MVMTFALSRWAQRGQPLGFILDPAVFNRYVLTLDIAALLETPAKCVQVVRLIVGRLAVEESDHWQGRLLPVRSNRPCRRAAEKRDELTSPHIRTQAQGPALYRLKRAL
jgi:hypothetical protein